jgi:hypothetical protein
VDGPASSSLPSHRHRRPAAFWLSIHGVTALMLCTVASFLRVIL